MGYDRHHAIIVTSWKDDWLSQARDRAMKLGLTVSDIVKSPLNAWQSFLVVPDGSKEGWPESDEGDKERTAFVTALGGEFQYDDHSSPLDWVEVQYGDDNHETVIVRHSDQR